MTGDDLYEEIAGLPIVSPHTHVDAAWLARDEVPDPVELLVSPDHYFRRLLHAAGEPHLDGRQAWRSLCRQWPAFRGTSSRLWLELQLRSLFGVPGLSPETADATYDAVAAQMGRPSALLARFDIELLATTDPALDPLQHHNRGADRTRLVPTLRADNVLDPTRPEWRANVAALGRLHDLDTSGWAGFVSALRAERARFQSKGALATDHGPSTADTLALTTGEAERLFRDVRAGAGEPAALGAHLLYKMAELSCDDGLVMQIHPGVFRDHDRPNFERHGPDIGADFPVAVEFTRPLRPLLEAFGNHPGFRLVVYSLDEAAYARELAPMASYYPALRLGAPWWFLDAPDAIVRSLGKVVEVAGFSRFAGFVDDARALCSIPARHEVARRAFCSYVARLVEVGRLSPGDAREVAADYAYHLPKAVFGV